MNPNKTYTKEYIEYINKLEGDAAGRRLAWDHMKNSTAVWMGHPCYISYIPRLYDVSMRNRFARITDTIYSILTKVIDRYINDAAYRQLFKFDSRVEELILLPRSYDEPIPFARIDSFYDEDNNTIKFCEFNVDASIGMNDSLEILNAIKETMPYKKFTLKHKTQDDISNLFEGWVQTFKQIYVSTKNAKENPNVAIVVCLDTGEFETGEFQRYLPLFQNAGMNASVFEVRDLSYDGKQLIGHNALLGQKDMKIDCIWRFCVVVDLLEHWGEVQPFINAVRDQNVPMIGSFVTQIVHDKQLFAVLRRSETQEFLTKEEQQLVCQSIPYTMFLDDDNTSLDEIKNNKDKWIIKPTDWYSCINVFAGKDYSQNEWNEIVDAKTRRSGASPYIVQEYCDPYPTPAIPLYGQEEDFTEDIQLFDNLVGMYVFAGKFAGMFSRMGNQAIITNERGGVSAATLWV